MSIEVGSAYVTLLPSLQQFWPRAQSQMRAGATQAGTVAGTAMGEQMAARANDSLARGMRGGTPAAAAAGTAAGTEYGSRFSDSVKTHLARLGAIVTTAATAAVGAAATIGVQTAAQMQQAEIAFTTMLGSGEKAKTFLNDLKDFAAATPFEFPQLQSAAQRLTAVGVEAERVIPIMTTVGNVIAGMGGSSESVDRATVALAQMANKGKVTGEEMMQLQEVGINGWLALAAATGKSTEELIDLSSKGKLGRESIEQLMSALESGAGFESFSGLMAAQSKSLSGVWSTLKDTFRMGMAGVMEPLIPLMTIVLQGATGLLEKYLPKVQAWVGGLVEGFDPSKPGAWAAAAEGGLSRVTAAASGLYALIVHGDYQGGLAGSLGIEEDSKIVDVILRVRDAIGSVVTSVRTADFSPILDGLAQFGPMLGSVLHLGPAFDAAVGQVNAVLGFLGEHVETIVEWMPAILAGFVAWKVAMAANALAGRDSAFGVAVTTVAMLIQSSAARTLALAYRQQAAALTLATQVTVTSTAASGASTTVTVSNTLTTQANTAAQNTGVLARMRAAAATAWHTVTQGASTAATWASTIAQRAFNAAMAANPVVKVLVVLGLLAGAFALLYKKNEAFREAVDAAWSKVKTVVVDAWEGTIRPALQALGDFVTSVWGDTIRPALVQFWEWVEAKVAPAVMDLWVNYVQPAFAAIGQFVGWLWGTVLQPILGAWWAYITQVLAPVLGWLWTNVVSPVFGWIGDKIVWTYWNLIKPALEALSKFITDVLVPKFQEWWPVVRDVFTRAGDKISVTKDFVLGVFDRLGAGVQAVRDTFSRVVDGIGSTWESMKAKVQEPIRFVVNDLVRDKLVAGWNSVASKVNLPTWDFKGFAGGGYTGPGGRLDVAGLVHRGEYVLRSEVVRDIMAHSPGLLDRINEHGIEGLGVPGYASGGPVDGTKPWPRYVKALLLSMFPGILSIGGYRPSSAVANSDHPKGLALDVMVPVRSPVGDAVSAWSIANSAALALKYLIWKQRIWSPSSPSWRGMSDRGSLTANHMDHPHLSFFDRWGDPGALGRVLSAEQVAALAGGSGSGGGMLGDLISSLLKPFFDGARGLVDGLAGRFGKSAFVDLLEGFAKTAISTIEKHLTGRANIPGPGGVGIGDAADVKMFDSGGFLDPGVTVAVNGTRQRETIRTFEQEAALQRQLVGAGVGGGGDVHLHGVDFNVRGAVEAEVAHALRMADLRRRRGVFAR